ncbi:S1 family peptidase [Glutamicibacter mishrai]|uniref:S1 family peptidase n=1 Tax=Glutamicibacter mishrai TaxID=1775880 RepID=UPI0020CE08E9|nr:S1 family peptidase [Glutamicibacter mishrai]UTT41172.1 S1 family peptidase [Glutamicibacter mishrai]
MPNPNKKTAQRGIVAAAATALVVGSSFMPAVAAPEATSSPSASASSSESATPSATTTEGAVDTTGLPEAIERDLDKTVDEYLEDSKANETAATLDKALEQEGIEATTSVKGGEASISVEKSAVKKAEKVVKETPTATEAVVKPAKQTPVNVHKVVENAIASIAPEELSKITAILQTSNGVKVLGKGLQNEKAEGTPDLAAASSKAAAEGDKLSLKEFVEVTGVATGKGSGAADTSADSDIYGGMGYAMDASGQLTEQSSVCSLGFNAWTAGGADAILSAGHCTTDGTMKILGLAEQSAPNTFEGVGAKVGTFGFNQFGGPGNTGPSIEEYYNSDPASHPIGTDISVIDDINPNLNLHPAVSQWPAGQDERDKTINITGVSKAVVGSDICVSGRTTGWSCSKMIAEGAFFVGGYKDDVRVVWGYTAENPGQTVLDQGDSGGSAIVGNSAVGINSANSPGADGIENNADDLAFYTSLDDVFEKGYIDGYAIKLFINAPTVTTKNGAEVEAGSEISGNVKGAKSGTKVDIIVDGKVVKTVTVDASGNFKFEAPDTTGTYNFTVQAHKGFDKSATTDSSVVIVAAPTPTPTPTETPTEEPTESATPTETPTEEPTESATPTETPTEEPTESATPTETPTEEPTESATPTETPTEEPTESATPTETPTEEPTESATPTESTPTTDPSESKTEESSEAPKDDKSDEPTKSATPKETPKKKDPLADTGSSSAPLIAAGGALALVGAMFLLFRRGNRRHG